MITSELLKTGTLDIYWLTNLAIFHRLLTGVCRAGIDRNQLIVIEYEDGTQETRLASQEILAKDVDDHSLLEWVSWVQQDRL